MPTFQPRRTGIRTHRKSAKDPADLARCHRIRAALSILTQVHRLRGISLGEKVSSSWIHSLIYNEVIEPTEADYQHGIAPTKLTLNRRLLNARRGLANRLEEACESLLGVDLPSLRLQDVLAEFKQIEDEFGAITIDLPSRTLSVTTEPIILEGYNFGEFRLSIDWKKLSRAQSAIEVTALTPHPAQKKPDVHHPHVRHNEICMGNGEEPIGDALIEGRLAEALMMLQSILLTYNAESPYAPIEEWVEPEDICPVCEDQVGNRFVCGCRSIVCRACTSVCHVCNKRKCDRCAPECSECNTHICSTCSLAAEDEDGYVCCNACAQHCEACDSDVHPRHYDDDHKMCCDCVPSEDEDEDEDDEEADEGQYGLVDGAIVAVPAATAEACEAEQIRQERLWLLSHQNEETESLGGFLSPINAADLECAGILNQAIGELQP